MWCRGEGRKRCRIWEGDEVVQDMGQRLSIMGCTAMERLELDTRGWYVYVERWCLGHGDGWSERIATVFTIWLPS